MKLLNLFGRYDARLIAAAAEGDVEGVKRALKHANPNAKNVGDASMFFENTPRNEDTAIMAAARLGHAECVRILASVSDLQEQHNTKWESALHLAADGSHVDCVNALLETPQADYLCRMMTLHRSDTALGLAAERGHAECVKALLPMSNANKLNGEGRTPLCLAVSAGFDRAIECVEMLAPCTAFPSLADIHPNEHGKRPQVDPLAEAVAAENAEMAALLAPLYSQRGQRDCVNPSLGLAVALMKNRQGGQWALSGEAAHQGWALADMLAFHAEEAFADKCLAEVGAGCMPRWCAHQEQIALSRIVEEGRSSKAERSIGGEAISSIAPSAGARSRRL